MNLIEIMNNLTVNELDVIYMEIHHHVDQPDIGSRRRLTYRRPERMIKIHVRYNNYLDKIKVGEVVRASYLQKDELVRIEFVLVEIDNLISIEHRDYIYVLTAMDLKIKVG